MCQHLTHEQRRTWWITLGVKTDILERLPIMTDPNEKTRRLADWYERLSNTFIIGSLDVWHRELRRELYQLKAQGLIDSGEAYELRKLADAAYGD